MLFMVTNIIRQQQEELENLLRQDYLERLDLSAKQEFLNTGLVKLITGPRRSGKSVLALQLLRGKKFAYLNFDDDLLLKNFSEDAVIQALNEVFPGYEYLVLDEIQNLQGWELWVNKLYRRGVNLVVTGSNAKLLSNEMATYLTGRYVLLAVYPFSFAEYLAFNEFTTHFDTAMTPAKKGEVLSLLNTWLLNGGFPEVSLNPSILKNYLATLFDSILLKDIIRRFKIRQSQQLYDLANYYLTNFTNPNSANQLKTDLGFNSVATVLKFTGYLSEPYLFISLTRYSAKIKLQQKSPKKCYVIDNGFIRARSFELSPNYGRLLENAVFVELLRRNFRTELELFYYRTANNREIDFLCRRGHVVTQLIQVCYDISSSKTFNRELDALVEASMELNCHNLLVITWDRDEVVEKAGCSIRLLPAWRWFDK
jgi:uncharacterized protein